MEALTIVETDNTAPDFYRLVGPFLGSRDVHRELGGPVYDDPGKLWWLAMLGGAVVGFCGLRVEGRVVKLCSAYVVPHARRSGVYEQLFQTRLTQALQLDLPIRGTVRPAAAALFLRHGFRIIRETANYATIERAPKAKPKARRGSK